MFTHIILTSLIFLQSLDVSDVTSIVSIKELSTSGLLLFGIIMLWRRMVAAEEKIDILIREKVTDYQKYADIANTSNKTIDENTRALDENARILQRIEKALDK